MALGRKALMVVDMQNDFITGSLPVPGANEIVGPIQDKIYGALAYHYSEYVVFFTACRHPPNHCSFKEFGGQWPAHCVVGSWGAEYQSGIAAVVRDLRRNYPSWSNKEQRFYEIYKGESQTIDQYSAFDVPTTELLLHYLRIHTVEICGLARDYCVEATAQGAKAAGFNPVIIEDLCRSVKVQQ